MKKNRLFNALLVTALALMVALTIQGTIATARVAYAVAPVAVPLCEFPAVERLSIHRVYVEQMKSWVTYTDDGPTGVDGGLIHLLSDTGTCAQ